MLELLHIENIAVIESADISFRPGFNALTGETGAGKSIVIDAMSAVLGGRASRELIRTGADKAFVSAVFSQVPPTLPGLADNGVTPDEDGNLHIAASGWHWCVALIGCHNIRKFICNAFHFTVKDLSHRNFHYSTVIRCKR